MDAQRVDQQKWRSVSWKQNEKLLCWRDGHISIEPHQLCYFLLATNLLQLLFNTCFCHPVAWCYFLLASSEEWPEPPRVEEVSSVLEAQATISISALRVMDMAIWKFGNSGSSFVSDAGSIQLVTTRNANFWPREHHLRTMLSFKHPIVLEFVMFRRNDRRGGGRGGWFLVLLQLTTHPHIWATGKLVYLPNSLKICVRYLKEKLYFE